jgi:hypothetical protein
MKNRVTTPPWLSDPFRWVSCDEFACRFSKSSRRIRKMCQTGDILSFGIRVHRDIPRGYGGRRDGSRWWIELPASEII